VNGTVITRAPTASYTALASAAGTGVADNAYSSRILLVQRHDLPDRLTIVKARVV